MLEENKYLWREVEKEEPARPCNEPTPSRLGSTQAQTQPDLMNLGFEPAYRGLGEPWTSLSSCCHLPLPNPLVRLYP